MGFTHSRERFASRVGGQNARPTQGFTRSKADDQGFAGAACFPGFCSAAGSIG